VTQPDQRLIKASLAIIEAGQTSEGAYLAAPNFPTYRYSWFRDGSFIATAMDDWGRTDSAAAFHQWVVSTLDRALSELGTVVPGPRLEAHQRLHTRYRPDGSAGDEDWPNFQLDGFGTWLWAYGRHRQGAARSLTDVERSVVRRLADYLCAVWSQPNFDCWEEHPELLHPSTLGALVAGIRAAASLLHDDALNGVADTIRSFVLTHGVLDGSFVKDVGSTSVDANLLWLPLTYRVVPITDALARGTIRRVRSELQDPDGGVKRYREDTFYGGGSWVLLTAALAEAHLALGEQAEADRLLCWIEAQATPEGALPEQVAQHLLAPDRIQEWNVRWGKSACPLLWSHASYLSLSRRYQERV
jgi:GH15 family glucan-1,4-alpha-glucosidase